MGDMKSAYTIFVGKPERKRSLGRSRRRWESNIVMDLTDIGWEVCGLDSSGSGLGTMESSFEHRNETVGSRKRREFLS